MTPEELDTLLDWITAQFHRPRDRWKTRRLVIARHAPTTATAAHVSPEIVAAWIVDDDGRRSIPDIAGKTFDALPAADWHAAFAPRTGTDTLCMSLSWAPRLGYGVSVRVQPRPARQPSGRLTTVLDGVLVWLTLKPAPDGMEEDRLLQDASGQNLRVMVVEHLWIS